MKTAVLLGLCVLLVVSITHALPTGDKELEVRELYRRLVSELEWQEMIAAPITKFVRSMTDCKDDYVSCADWAENGECTTSKYKEKLQAACVVSCNTPCTVTTTK